MTSLNPMRIEGPWKEGFALDYHTIGSTYIGDNEFGYPMFENEYSDVGGLLFRLKSRTDTSVVDVLAGIITDYVRTWNCKADLIVPVPPSKTRIQQPVLMLGDAVGKGLGIAFNSACIVKTKSIPELKNVREFETRLKLLEGAFRIERAETEGRKILLFDDLFRSGASMGAVAKALSIQGAASDVFALAVTRTRVNR